MNGYISKVKSNFFRTKDFEGLLSGGIPAAIRYYVPLLGILVIFGFIVNAITIDPTTALIASIFAIFLHPVIIVLLTGMSQVLLKLLGGSRSIGETAQMYIYGMTPSLLFGWVPLLGSAAGIMTLINVYRGIKELNRISSIRAAVVVVLPYILMGLGMAILVLIAMMSDPDFMYSGGY